MHAGSSLVVIGAGPKGLAIAAKRAALSRAGRDVPDLVLIDRAGVAANWSGASGYTDGRQLLSTPPEKDLGIPTHRAGVRPPAASATGRAAGRGRAT
jgi:hypothetical protein